MAAQGLRWLGWKVTPEPVWHLTSAFHLTTSRPTLESGEGMLTGNFEVAFHGEEYRGKSCFKVTFCSSPDTVVLLGLPSRPTKRWKRR